MLEITQKAMINPRKINEIKKRSIFLHFSIAKNFDSPKFRPARVNGER